MRISLPLVAAIVTATAAGPTVKTSAGTLEGGVCANNPQAVYFKSIPFAQPPINDLRFAAPQPFTQKYEGGVRNATTAAPACVQFGSAFLESGATSEDCLYVDIWAPANATNTSALPVRAWVFGGSDSAGGLSDPLYDGCNVPKTNAIMVSINYRLGPLGFLALRSAGIEGNQAIQDIILGLQWIQDNVAAFGGDPKKVMLHAQSSGALNSFVVATLPQAPKLFSSIIMESGGGRDQPDIERGEVLSQSYSEALNCSASDATCLRSASVDALQDAYNTAPLLNELKLPALGINTIDALTFGPIVDGKIVPAQPSEVGANVPAIFGSNGQDGMLFSLVQFPGAPESAIAQNYTQFLNENFGSAAPQIEQHYPLSAFNASPYPAFTAMGTVMTDASYLCTTYRGAKTSIAKNLPVWVYYFDHSPKCSWLPAVPDSALPLIGATHTSEIPFMLGNIDNLPQPNGNCTMSPDEQALSRFMATAWTTFAATQQPTAESAEWPMFGGANNTVGMTFANTTVVGKIDYSICEALWDQVYADQVAAADNGSYVGEGTGDRTNVSSISAASLEGGADSARVSGILTVFGFVMASIVYGW